MDSFPLILHPLEEWEKRKREAGATHAGGDRTVSHAAQNSLNAVIHGKINRPGFTVEKSISKVFPVFIVTGPFSSTKSKE